MADFDPEEFLSRKHFALTFRSLVSDVEDFLEFSEQTLAWQHRNANQAIQRNPDLGEYPEGYIEHFIASTEHRFAVSLPMRLRYASLVALVTTMEWEGRVLGQIANFRLEPKPKERSETVHILKCFDRELSLGAGATIDDYERLVHVRNVVSHNAGIAAGYRHEAQLRNSVDLLSPGFTIANWNFLGDCVKIERGALTPYIRAMADRLPRIWQAADNAGKVRK